MIAELANELVLVIDQDDPTKGTLYPHEQFIAAQQEATLDRLAALVPEGGTMRQALKALASMRTTAAHKLVLTDALRRLRRKGTPINPDSVAPEHVVVAAFPGT